jgi:hypothetical protein
VISRYVLTALVFGIGLMRVVQGAWMAAAGLFAMGAGLVLLKMAERKPALRPYAYVCFLGTAAAIITILMQGDAFR